MTHILITDLREIRYMAYVPEEPKDWTDDEGYLASLSSPLYARKMKEYREALEKAKRESVPFDREEDNGAIKRLMTDWINPELKPGIYQVPVEVEVVEIPEEDSGIDGSGPPYAKVDFKKVARIVQPKEESQEDEWQVFQYEPLEVIDVRIRLKDGSELNVWSQLDGDFWNEDLRIFIEPQHVTHWKRNPQGKEVNQ